MSVEPGYGYALIVGKCAASMGAPLGSNPGVYSGVMSFVDNATRDGRVSMNISPVPSKSDWAVIVGDW